MDDVIRGVLDARLATSFSRRRLIQGAGGLAALVVLGGRGVVRAQSGQLNYIGYDGEDARNVAKPFLTVSAALSSATPPPGTMPSSRAARVACSASSTRCFFCFISVSVAAPT